MTQNIIELFSKYDILQAIHLTGSLSAAARRLKVTQPSISTAMKGMEAAAGFPLLQRHSHGVSLTSESKQLLTELGKLHQSLSQTIQTLESSGAKRRAELHIGSKPIYLSTLWPFYLQEIEKILPEVNVQLHILRSNLELERRLEANELDVLLIPLDSERAKFVDYHLYYETFGIFSHRDFTPLAGPIYALEKAYLGGKVLWERFFDQCQQLNIDIEFLPDYASVKNLVMLKQGFGLLPASYIKGDEYTDRIAEFPEIQRTISEMNHSVGFRLLTPTPRSRSKQNLVRKLFGAVKGKQIK